MENYKIFEPDSFTKVYHIPFKILLNYNIELPDFQRSYSTERVNHFIESLLKDLDKYNEFLSFLPIVLGKIENEEKYYIIDGQHRFKAFEKILGEEYDLEEFENFRVVINIRESKNFETLQNYFFQLNNHYITELPNVINIDVANELKNIIKTNYSNFISHAENPRFPNINLDSFVNFIIERFPKNTIELFYNYNNSLCEYLSSFEDKSYHDILRRGTLYLTYVYHENRKKSKVHRIKLTKVQRRM
jgi:hypothetical protein